MIRIIIILIIIIIVIGIWYYYIKSTKDEKIRKRLFGETKEKFLGDLPNMGFKTTPSFSFSKLADRGANDDSQYNHYENFSGTQKKLDKVNFRRTKKPMGLQDGFFSTPTFQKEVSSRMTGGIDFHSNINNGLLPAPEDMAVNSCGVDGKEKTCSDDFRSEELLDNPNQPVIYDRLMYSNKKSRLMEHNDMIRGSLPIMPKYGEWFRPSVDPLIDLQRGAMNVLAGQGNNVSLAFKNLFSAEGAPNVIPEEMNNTTFVKANTVETANAKFNKRNLQTTPSYKTNFLSGNQDINVVQAFPN